MIERAHAAGVKVTAMSCKETCDLVIMMKEEQSPLPSDRVGQFASFLCKLDRGGYVVMLGVVPLEMMLLYEMKDYAAQYVALLKMYENGLSRHDLVYLEKVQRKYASDPKLASAIRDVIKILKQKFSC